MRWWKRDRYFEITYIFGVESRYLFLGASPVRAKKREKRGHVGRILAAGGAQVFMRAAGKGVYITISGCVASCGPALLGEIFSRNSGTVWLVPADRGL